MDRYISLRRLAFGFGIQIISTVYLIDISAHLPTAMDISHITLAPRGLFGGDDKNFTCARPIPGQHGKTLSIGVSAKSLLIYITLACLGLTSISAFILQWKHLHRYTMPKEQRQIIRIVWLPVFFCIISLLAVIFYDQSIYVEPIKEVYEAFCIAALFLLYVEYVCPDEHERPAFFTKLENKNRKGKVIPGGSLVWWHVRTRSPLPRTIHSLTISPAHIRHGPPIPPHKDPLRHRRNRHPSRQRLLPKLLLPKIRPHLHRANQHLHNRGRHRRRLQILRQAQAALRPQAPRTRQDRRLQGARLLPIHPSHPVRLPQRQNLQTLRVADIRRYLLRDPELPDGD